MTASRTTTASIVGDLRPLVVSWLRHLRAANLAPKTSSRLRPPLGSSTPRGCPRQSPPSTASMSRRYSRTN